jgi:hypothetical protein
MLKAKSVAWPAGVCLLCAISLLGQVQIPNKGLLRDAAAAAASKVEPNSPRTGTTVAAGLQAVVPRLMKFSGALRDAAGRPLTGTVDVTFSLYNSEAGGDALWYETQTVQADELGRYTALLGAMHSDGLPADLFFSGEARWLGIQVGSEAEQPPRVLLVSVPYALKAGDAETLGGKPASAYMVSDSQSAATPASSTAAGTAQTGTSAVKQAGTSRKSNAATLTACSPVTSGGTATANYLARFTTACNVEASGLYQAGTNYGIGTTSPSSLLHLAGNNATLTITGTGTHQINIIGATGGRLGQDAAGFFFSSDTNGGAIRFATNNGVLHEGMRITSGGNVGINLAAPTHRLDVVGDISAVISGTDAAIRGANMGAGAGDGVDGIVTNAAGTGAGVYGESDGTAGYGVYGYAGAATGTNYGVYGWAISPDGTGVYGQGGKWAGYFAGDVYSSGNVGIGTATPTANLEVKGTAKFDDVVTFAGAQSFPHVGVFNTTTLFNNISGATTNYIRIDGMSSATTNEVLRASIMPTSCTAGNLTVRLGNSSSVTVILRVNGGSSALGCTISNGNMCTDAVHTVAVTPGNLLSIQLLGDSTGDMVYTAFTCG